MNIKVTTQGPLGVKEQIKRQIRALAETGQIGPGEALPSSRDLATLLGVNRNTTWAAYKELAAEGLLESVKGKGTFVRAGRARPELGRLGPVFDQALAQARQLGVEPQEAAERFWDHVCALPSLTAGRRLLVVECNQETLDSLAGELERELGVRADKVLIQDLEEDPGLAARLTKDVDLVVCGFNHLEEFGRAAPRCAVEAVPVMLTPELGLAKILAGLPAGGRVGFTCVNQRSTENLYKHRVFQSGASLHRILVGADDTPRLKQMLASCEVVFASVMVYERVRRLAGRGKKVIKVDVSVERAGVELVRRALVKQGWRES